MSKAKQLREWTIQTSAILEKEAVGPGFDVREKIKVREVSAEYDAAVEGMAKAIKEFGKIPMRGSYKDAELKCHMRLFNALEAFDAAAKGLK